MNAGKTFGEIIQGDKPVLVDFFAEWCGPCKTMAPVLKELKELTGDAATILKLDVDRNGPVAATYQIQGVPTLILFQKGKVKWRQSGVVSAREMKSQIDKVLAST